MSSNFTRTDFPRQYDHVAVIAHGAHPEYRLEFDAPVASTASGIYQGSIVYLNADGEFMPFASTIHAGTVNKPVPMVSMKNLYDPDVQTGLLQSSTVSYARNTYSAVGGKITAIPCTGGYEIETSEYVEPTSPATFSINDALTVGTGDNTAKVVQATGEIVGGGAGTIIGFLSKKPFQDNAKYYGKRISFFTNFIPASNGN